ncbi:hypothetical protein [Bacillus sp. 03113]|uniref:hypothetical protein n=1 Tax=Bacillus sp. 03113 TaxID=2578211 RepID=UPI0011449769|nr:hypothetical protein [Bacillus sp. 03113]
MEIFIWLFISVLCLVVLRSVFYGVISFISIWEEKGFKIALFVGIFVLLLLSPGIVKDYAPQYYGYSIWAVILYALGFLFYRHFIKGTSNENEGDS